MIESQSRCSIAGPRVIYNLQPGAPMKHLSVVVQQLKKEREHVQQQVQRIDQALAALGSSSNGSSRTMSAAGRRRISLAQKARWAKKRTAKRSDDLRSARDEVSLPWLHHFSRDTVATARYGGIQTQNFSRARNPRDDRRAVRGGSPEFRRAGAEYKNPVVAAPRERVWLPRDSWLGK